MSTSASRSFSVLTIALQAEGPDEHAIADRDGALRSGGSRRLDCGRCLAGWPLRKPLGDGVQRRASVGACRAGLAGRNQPRARRRSASMAIVSVRVFNAPTTPSISRLRFAQPFLDPLVEPAAERLLAGLQLLLARRAASPTISPSCSRSRATRRRS